jgi:GT2 family glycosyltransferase
VVIASTGRPHFLGPVVGYFLGQTMPPARIILSVAGEQDVPADLPADPRIQVLPGPRGLPAQRNTALRACAGREDIIAFFDDDYVPSRYCLEDLAAFMAANPAVIGIDGGLLADGIHSTGLSLADAEAIVARYDSSTRAPICTRVAHDGLYGCNMAFRASSISGVMFDERLKLYGWQEDIDFTGQLRGRGTLLKTNAFHGVHCGAKGGRTSGLRLGYSQVINPLYLIRKGTMRTRFGLGLLLRNVASNLVRMWRPEPWIDRRGRARGNWLGLRDAVRGRLTPERIESL